jgi:hypothetical protein
MIAGTKMIRTKKVSKTINQYSVFEKLNEKERKKQPESLQTDGNYQEKGKLFQNDFMRNHQSTKSNSHDYPTIRNN